MRNFFQMFTFIMTLACMLCLIIGSILLLFEKTKKTGLLIVQYATIGFVIGFGTCTAISIH